MKGTNRKAIVFDYSNQLNKPTSSSVCVGCLHIDDGKYNPLLFNVVHLAGNVRLKDIGTFLKSKIREHFNHNPDGPGKQVIYQGEAIS